MSQDERTGLLRDRAHALGIAIDAEPATRLLAYLDAMLELNRSLNLTAVRDPAAAEVLHVLDSVAVDLAGVAPRAVLDIGSGNGFPGVALAILYSTATVTLLERTAKKARALEQLLAGAGLDNARVLHMDAAQVPALQPELARHFDLVTARAVAPPDRIARLAAPLTAPNGHLLLWLDRDAVPNVGHGFKPVRMLPYELPEPAPRERVLAVARLSGR